MRTGARRYVVALFGVLLHRIVDQIINAALQLSRHLFELVPKRISALERSWALLVRISAHLEFGHRTATEKAAGIQSSYSASFGLPTTALRLAIAVRMFGVELRAYPCWG
jgi:hypothetical protein